MNEFKELYEQLTDAEKIVIVNEMKEIISHYED